MMCQPEVSSFKYVKLSTEGQKLILEGFERARIYWFNSKVKTAPNFGDINIILNFNSIIFRDGIIVMII